MYPNSFQLHIRMAVYRPDTWVFLKVDEENFPAVEFFAQPPGKLLVFCNCLNIFIIYLRNKFSIQPVIL